MALVFLKPASILFVAIMHSDPTDSGPLVTYTEHKVFKLDSQEKCNDLANTLNRPIDYYGVDGVHYFCEIEGYVPQQDQPDEYGPGEHYIYPKLKEQDV